MGRQVDVYLYVCMCFQVLTQLGRYTNSSRIKEGKGSRGRLRRICAIYSFWGAERIRLKIADRSEDRCEE